MRRLLQHLFCHADIIVIVIPFLLDIAGSVFLCIESIDLLMVIKSIIWFMVVGMYVYSFIPLGSPSYFIIDDGCLYKLNLEMISVT